jgi:Cof subfamily protein (haloacid dehalogenase superfamily)
LGIFEGCLLACDVDGTLVENGNINPKNIEKIEYFMSEGGFFSIATGRSVTAISSVTEKLKNFSPSVVANGSMIYDYVNQKVVYEDYLAREDYNIVKETLESNLDVGIEVHTGDRIFTVRRTKRTDIHQIYEGLETTVMSFEEACKYNWNKLLFTGDNMADFEKLKEISKKYTNSDFVATAVCMKDDTQHYFEQLPKGVSKASAIKKLCDIFNIKKGCSYAIGDFYNDIEMLKNADICAVPEGSPEGVKSLADFVAVSCKDGAVADFIDYLTKIHSNLK